MLPTEDALIVPEGCHLDGWLVRGGSGWSETPIYEIAENTSGVFELTPNWVPDTPAEP